MTDLDLLAIEVDATLGFRRTIGEAKSGTSRNSPKPLDRVIWLRGLMEITDAEAAELTSELAPSNRVRQLAESLGVRAQSTKDLARRESNLRIEDVADQGIFGVKWVAESAGIRKACSTEPELERAFWFLRSEVWFLDPFAALKRTLTTLRFLADRWTPAARDEHEYAIRWMLCEATVVATLNIVGIAGHAVRLGGDALTEAIDERLAEGSIPAHRMRAIANSFDSYLVGILKELKAPQSAVMQAVGAFEPRPPDYAPAVSELARRLAAGSVHARQLPRWADLMCFERVLRENEPSALAVERLGCGDPTKVAHAGRLVASFLRGQANLPEPLVAALGTAPTAAARNGAIDVAIMDPGPGPSHGDRENSALQLALPDVGKSDQQARIGDAERREAIGKGNPTQ